MERASWPNKPGARHWITRTRFCCCYNFSELLINQCTSLVFQRGWDDRVSYLISAWNYTCVFQRRCGKPWRWMRVPWATARKALLQRHSDPLGWHVLNHKTVEHQTHSFMCCLGELPSFSTGSSWGCLHGNELIMACQWFLRAHFSSSGDRGRTYTNMQCENSSRVWTLWSPSCIT